jgi:predicted HTH domain antitoxin
MKQTISIDCSPEILIGLHLSAERFGDYLKQQAAISLFKEGRISSGTAASWLEIPRVAFLRLVWDAGAVLLENSSDDFERETALLSSPDRWRVSH